ncbi:MAG: hypothetical protein AAF688_01065 [Bacteroidota bacterium]
MPTLLKHIHKTPYLYFLAIIIYWFADIYQRAGFSAYLILLLSLPFLWQIIKPNRKLSLSLGVLFFCLSSYLILAYLSDVYKIGELTKKSKEFLIVGGLFVSVNFLMAIWILISSFKKFA